VGASAEERKRGGREGEGGGGGCYDASRSEI